jgi:hypothetical protein
VELFFKRIIAKKVRTARSRTNNKIFPLIDFNKYLYNSKSAPIKSGLSPLLIGATYGSIQSVTIPDTVNIQLSS